MNEPLGMPPPLPAYKDRRGWLIAFGVVEILIACFFLLMALLMAALLPNMMAGLPKTAGQPEVPGGLFYGMGAIYGLIGAVFAAAGVGSIQAKNWARILMVVVSSLWLGFGILGTLGYIVILPVMMRQEGAILAQNPAARGGELPPHFMTIMMIVMIVFQILTMVLLPLVLLLFYTRKNVRMTCQAMSIPPSTALPAPSLGATAGVSVPAFAAPPARAANALPVPIVFTVVCFLLLALGKVVALVFPLTVFFGLILHGISARFVVAALAAADLYCAWNFYRLRIQGWWMAMAVFVFSLTSGVVTTFKVDERNFIDEAYRQIGISAPASNPAMAIGFDAHSIRIFMLLGWLIWIAAFVFLIYTKRYFDARQKAR